MRQNKERVNMMLYDTLISPFIEFEFMRRALAGSAALAVAGAPIGVFLMLRRMSLVGDAMAHAILPGAAIGFLLSGLSLFAMTVGGLVAGFAVALLSGIVTRFTESKEDASLAAFYLVSLALGVTIVSIRGTNIDLLHVLFGNVLALDDPTLLVIAFNATVTLLVLAVIYRPLVIECVDPTYLRSVSRGRRAGASRLPRACRHQPRQRLPCARHAARGRPDDPAGLRRPLLGARSHPHHRDRGRRPRSSPAMPGSCCRSTRRCRRAPRSSSWPRWPMSCRCCSARSADSCARCSPAASGGLTMRTSCDASLICAAACVARFVPQLRSRRR